MKKIFVILIMISLISPVFAEMVSASSNIEIGTVLYNSDGSVFGKVLDVDAKHTFPNGKTESGVLVDFGGDAKPQWVVRSFITQSKYVQKAEGSSGSGCCCGPAFLSMLGAASLFVSLIGKFLFLK